MYRGLEKYVQPQRGKRRGMIADRVSQTTSVSKSPLSRYQRADRSTLWKVSPVETNERELVHRSARFIPDDKRVARGILRESICACVHYTARIIPKSIEQRDKLEDERGEREREEYIAIRRKEIIKQQTGTARGRRNGITNNLGTCKQFERCVEKWF